MKKILSFVLVGAMLVSAMVTFSGCGIVSGLVETAFGVISGFGMDTEPIEKAVSHIEKDELDKALEVCKDMDKEVIEYGTYDILEAVTKKLEYYCDFDNWTCTDKYLVDTDAVNVLKAYSGILATLSFDEDDTNVDDFIAAALQLEKYAEWNEYYISNEGEYFTRAMEYIDKGQEASGDDAVEYYEKAYSELNKAYELYDDSQAKGLKEAAEFYGLYALQIRSTIDGDKISTSDKKAFERAYEDYLNAVKAYNTARTELVSALQALPQ